MILPSSLVFATTTVKSELMMRWVMASLWQARRCRLFGVASIWGIFSPTQPRRAGTRLFHQAPAAFPIFSPLIALFRGGPIGLKRRFIWRKG